MKNQAKKGYNGTIKSHDIIEHIKSNRDSYKLLKNYAKSTEKPTWLGFIQKNRLVCCSTDNGTCLSDSELNLNILNNYLLLVK